MTKLKEWWAKSRWAVWALLGFVVVMLLAMARAFLGKKVIPGLPEIPKVLQDKVDKAEEDGLRARVEATTHADDEKKHLDEVLKINDGAERRKRLAELASKK